MKVIRDIAESAGLEEGKNLVLNKYVTEIHYNETGDTPVKVVSKDTRTGKMTIFRAKWVIVTFRSLIIFKYIKILCFLRFSCLNVLYFLGEYMKCLTF